MKPRSKRLLSGLLLTTAALLCANAASATYTKIANNGFELDNTAVRGSGATEWACTRDNATGLIWQVNQGGSYTNYDSNYGTSTQINASTNSIGYVNAVNTAALCGYGEWRMPNPTELSNDVLPNMANGYFPNVQSYIYWSSAASGTTNALYVDFRHGQVLAAGRFNNYLVILVRGGSAITPLLLSATTAGTGAGGISTGGIHCLRDGGGTIGSCSTSRGSGSTVLITATPDAGSVFSGWGGDCSGTNLTCSLTMNAAKTVTASFAKSTATRSIVIDPVTPANVYAALDGAGVYRSVNSGANWTAASTQPGNLNLKALVIKPGSPATLFAASYGGGVYQSTNSGVNWATCATQPTNQNLLSLAVDTAGKLYAGSEAGVFVSTDNCGTWATMNTGLPP